MAVIRTQFSLRLDPIVYAKLKKIAKEDNRSVSNLIDYIIKQCINEYESKNGDIVLSEKDIYGSDI